MGTVTNLLESGLKFSLTFSSRPPQLFLPHQKILKIMDEHGLQWMQVSAVLSLWVKPVTLSISLSLYLFLMQWMGKLPVLFLKCGLGGISPCGSITLFLSRYILFKVWLCVCVCVCVLLTEETPGFVVCWLACRTSQRLVIMIFHYLICLFSPWIQQQSSRFCKLISNYILLDNHLNLQNC